VKELDLLRSQLETQVEFVTRLCVCGCVCALIPAANKGLAARWHAAGKDESDAAWRQRAVSWRFCMHGVCVCMLYEHGSAADCYSSIDAWVMHS